MIYSGIKVVCVIKKCSLDFFEVLDVVTVWLRVIYWLFWSVFGHHKLVLYRTMFYDIFLLFLDGKKCGAVSTYLSIQYNLTETYRQDENYQKIVKKSFSSIKNLVLTVSMKVTYVFNI